MVNDKICVWVWRMRQIVYFSKVTFVFWNLSFDFGWCMCICVCIYMYLYIMYLSVYPVLHLWAPFWHTSPYRIKLKFSASTRAAKRRWEDRRAAWGFRISWVSWVSENWMSWNFESGMFFVIEVDFPQKRNRWKFGWPTRWCCGYHRCLGSEWADIVNLGFSLTPKWISWETEALEALSYLWVIGCVHQKNNEGSHTKMTSIQKSYQDDTKKKI